MKRIWKINTFLYIVLLCATLLALPTYGAASQQNDISDSNEYYLNWDDLTKREKIVFLIDQSGSSGNSDLADSLKNIARDIVYQDSNADCMILGFDETCRIIEEKDIRKVTRKETDLLNALQCTDNYVANGKTPISLMVFSDFYDTCKGGSKLNPETQGDILSARQKEIKEICDKWNENTNIKNLCYYYWEAPQEKADGYPRSLVDNILKNDESKQETLKNLKQDSSELQRMQCVRDSLNIIKGRDDLEWENYADIPEEEESNYVEYYIFTRGILQPPTGKNDDQVFDEIDKVRKNSSRIYYVKNIAMSQLGLNQSIYPVFILRIPQIKAVATSGRVWNKSASLKEEMPAFMAFNITQDGKKIHEKGFSIVVDCFRQGENKPCHIWYLKYDDVQEQYYDEFIIPEAGKYDAHISLNNGNEQRELGIMELEVEKADVQIRNSTEFLEKIAEVTKTGVEIPLDKYFENLNNLEFNFQDGPGLEHNYSSDKNKLTLFCADSVKQKSNSFLIIEAKYRESENAGKTFRAKVHIILNPNSDSGKER